MMRCGCLCTYASTYMYSGTHVHTTHTHTQTLHYTVTDDIDAALHDTLYTIHYCDLQYTIRTRNLAETARPFSLSRHPLAPPSRHRLASPPRATLTSRNVPSVITLLHRLRYCDFRPVPRTVRMHCKQDRLRNCEGADRCRFAPCDLPLGERWLGRADCGRARARRAIDLNENW